MAEGREKVTLYSTVGLLEKVARPPQTTSELLGRIERTIERIEAMIGPEKTRRVDWKVISGMVIGFVLIVFVLIFSKYYVPVYDEVGFAGFRKRDLLKDRMQDDLRRLSRSRRKWMRRNWSK